jgi:predicted O-methyltransferase YrrM
MTDTQWNAVDHYFDEALTGEDPVLAAALAASAEAGLPAINVSPNQGKLLFILAQAIGAKRILEIGTLGGYSAIWLARALPPDGRLMTLERDQRHADIARANIARANLADRVEVRLGIALDLLPDLAREGAGPFDLIFIDADKPSTTDYFDWALRLSRQGTLIVVDNVVRGGAVIDAASDNVAVQGVRRFIDRLGNEPRVTATAMQTVGSKGYDGFAIALVTKGA